MRNIVDFISDQSSVDKEKVEQTLEQLKLGYSVPFILQYRTHKLPEIDNHSLWGIYRAFRKFNEFNQRKLKIRQNLEERSLYSGELKNSLDECQDPLELEDIYLPYKPRRNDKAREGIEKGLSELAERVINQEDVLEGREFSGGADATGEVDKILETFINDEKGLPNIWYVRENLVEILKDRIARNPEILRACRKFILESASFITKLNEKSSPDQKQKIRYDQFKDFKMPVKDFLKPENAYKYLQLKLSREEKVYKVELDFDQKEFKKVVSENVIKKLNGVFTPLLQEVIDSACFERILPLADNQVRMIIKEVVEKRVIPDYQANLRRMLMQPRFTEAEVLGVYLDSGREISIVHLSKGGSSLVSARFDWSKEEPFKPVLEWITERLKGEVRGIACSSGQGSSEFLRSLREHLLANELKPVLTVVNRNEAQVYSASEQAKERFPAFAAGLIAAHFIGRRFQDPLSELLKIPVDKIRLGRFQGVLDREVLRASLSDVVEECVARVGLNYHDMDFAVLSALPGISEDTLKALAEITQNKEPVISREQLKEKASISDREFEKIAGFIRVNNPDEPLERTRIHPNSYGVVKKWLEMSSTSVEEIFEKNLSKEVEDNLKKTQPQGISPDQQRFYLRELKSPGRDPRRTLNFEELFIRKDDDLKSIQAGKTVFGVITQVRDYGVFLDFGISFNGLIHLSEISAHWVPDPLNIVFIGEIVKAKILKVDPDKKQVSLTLRGLGGSSSRKDKPLRAKRSANFSKPSREKRESRDPRGQHAEKGRKPRNFDRKSQGGKSASAKKGPNKPARKKEAFNNPFEQALKGMKFKKQ